MGSIRSIFDRVVKCGEVMKYITDPTVKEKLNTISCYSRVSARAGDGQMHLSMVLAHQRAVMKAIRYLARHFKSLDEMGLSRSYWNDFRDWKLKVKETHKRLEKYGLCNHVTGSAAANDSGTADCNGRVGRIVQTG